MTRKLHKGPAIVGAFDAKTHFSELLDRVEGGETITITRKGIPVAKLSPLGDKSAIVPPEDLRRRFLTFQEAHPIYDISTRDLINEGRKL